MASSGSFLTSGYYSSTGNDTIYLKFSWEIVSQSTANNTSTISWKLTGSRTHTGYVNAGGFKIVIDGDTVYEKSTDYRIQLYNDTVVASGTKTLTHDSKGKRSFEVYAEGGIYYYAVNCTGSTTFTLDTLARASTITSAYDVTLGKTCKVKWTPKSASFRYKLKFAIGDWSYTTGVIHPNTTSAYTHTGYTIPIDGPAQEITDDNTGAMKVTLYTYSNSAGTTQVGSADSENFTVTVPENSSTRPTVSMTLAPVTSLGDTFAGLYIQGKTKVKATLSGTGKYGASITAYSMMVADATYDSDDDYTTDYLDAYGSVTIYGYSKDSRGFTGSVEQAITFLPYSKPRVMPVSGEDDVIAARCDANGNLTDSGTYLKIIAMRSYSKVESGGTQHNFCRLRYRYKLESAESYSSWTTILAKDSLDSDEIATEALLGGVLAVDSSYLVQVQAIDDVGEYGYTTITIPTDRVYMHRDKAKRAMAFGKYIEEENCFDIAEDISLKTRGPIDALGGGNVDCLKVGIKLTATADSPLSLDDLKTPGSYYSPNAETSQYITKSPRGNGGGFGLRVRELQNSSYIRQEQYFGRTTWVRHWDGETWSDWLRYLTTTIDETPVADFVIESGTEGGWTYKKWKGGTYEMFGTFEITPPASTLRDMLYRTDNMTIALPFKISSATVTGTAVGFYWLTNGGISGDNKITLRLMGTRVFDTTTAIEVRLMVVGTYA